MKQNNNTVNKSHSGNPNKPRPENKDDMDSRKTKDMTPNKEDRKKGKKNY